MVMVGGHMLSSKGLSVVLGLQTTWLLIWLVLPLVCLHAGREGNGDGDGEGWREERQVERPRSACWILIPGTGYAFVCQMVAREGLEEAITGATEGLPAWMHPEAVWQRDGPIRGRLDIHTVMSKSHLVSTPKSSFWQTLPPRCKYLCDYGTILIVTRATVSTTLHVEHCFHKRYRVYDTTCGTCIMFCASFSKSS